MRNNILVCCIICLLWLQTQAQNVGVGTNTPTEKLDVNGSLNVSGNIKLNGNAGRAGQVLMMGGNGQQNWANMFGYKNRKEFYAAGTWTVPTGVTEIMIEAIAAGGGGAKGGGGGGGAYVIGVFKVAPGQLVQINTVGVGGAGSATETGTGNAGSNTDITISGTTNNIIAQGGQAAGSTYAGYGLSYVIDGDSLIYTRGYSGNNGSPTTEYYSQRTSTEFVTVRKYGDGGICMYEPARVNKGTYYSFNTVTLTNIVVNYATSTPLSNGSGGGGGNTSFFTWGYPGSNGLAAISW